MKRFLEAVKITAMKNRGEIEDAIDARRGEGASTISLQEKADAADLVIQDLNKRLK